MDGNVAMDWEMEQWNRNKHWNGSVAMGWKWNNGLETISLEMERMEQWDLNNGEWKWNNGM
ncbi:hypothetical protein CEXT_724211, partial [Caerostris extrusa]